MKNKKQKFPPGLAFLYIFTAVFIIAPLAYAVILSFLKQGRGVGVEYTFTLDNYKNILNPIYLRTFAESAKLSAVTTVLCAVIGYPAGLFIAGMKGKLSKFFITGQMIPFWVNSLIRLYGWIIIFRADGLLDKLLMFLGITNEPLMLLYSYPAVVVGMVYVLLPFMIFSVYSVAAELDETAAEAARDLGATKRKVFLTITLPLTSRGLMTGVTLTLIPSMGLFFIASILGGNKVVLVGNLIQEQLMTAHNLPFAATLSVVLMILTGIVLGITRLAGRHRTSGKNKLS